MILMLALPGCGKAAEAEETEEEQEEETETKEKKSKKKNKDKDEESEEQADPSFAKRLCGKYSCEGDGDEVLTMEICEFGGNVYAYCGECMSEEGDEELIAYSYWAMELLPDDPDGFKKTDADSCNCEALYFSNMSHAGMYWDEPKSGVITLTDEGVKFEGFDESVTKNAEYKRDDKAEDAFPYINPANKKAAYNNEDLNGYWLLKEDDSDTYLWFDAYQNMWIYRKHPAVEVILAGGAYEVNGNRLNAVVNALGSGHMPSELSAAFDVNKDTLSLTDISEDLAYMSDQEFDSEVIFVRVKEDDIPVITASDAEKAGAGQFSGFYDDPYEGADVSDYYGVWVGAYTYIDEAYELVDKLQLNGFDAAVAYSLNWKDLTNEPYYCVTAGKCQGAVEADDLLNKVKDAGYKDAYVKNTGKRVATRVELVNYSTSDFVLSGDKVILKDVEVNDPELYDNFHTDLIVDKETLFDDHCEFEFFGNYEKNDLPMDWIKRNLELEQTDPDKYMENGIPALIGVFDVSITGKHVDAFYGSYWWD